MSHVLIKEHSFDVDLIVFDKDGTLIKLDLWGHQLEKWGNLLRKRLDLSAPFMDAFYREVGYDVVDKRLMPDTPVAVGSLAQLMTIGSFLLYRQGASWTAAEEAVHEAAAHSLEAVPEPSMLELIGDVPGTFERLRKSGIRIAVATSDDRLPTEKTLELLQIESMVDLIVCANDPIPKKPAPDGLLHISRELGIPISRMLMVGDSMGDMQCGRAAGVAGCIRIGLEPERGTALSDLTIESIDEIRVVGKARFEG